MTKKHTEAEALTDRAHAPGKRHLGRAQGADSPQRDEQKPRQRDQPWLPTNGLVGRTRRSSRRS